MLRLRFYDSNHFFAFIPVVIYVKDCATTKFYFQLVNACLNGHFSPGLDGKTYSSPTQEKRNTLRLTKHKRRNTKMRVLLWLGLIASVAASCDEHTGIVILLDAHADCPQKECTQTERNFIQAEFFMEMELHDTCAQRNLRSRQLK